MPVTRAGIPSAAGRGSRNWPRSARVAEAGRGDAGSFRCPAAGRQRRLEAVPTADRGLQPFRPRPALPTRANGGSRRPGTPRSHRRAGRGGWAEKRGPAASRHFQVTPPEAQSEQKKRQKDAGEGVPTLPRTPRARPGPYS